ncbi:SET and MYND domain-containing protein 4-like isoform X2 [Athalia rosae]|uniref:SET and MYND domain-containing protein 4-like isoform X2 n=1 Tax=Athalia rosae TaxID=37344 RepID=UPI0020333248|nr:SET and MYND domain-containing protein 4-like isoform X2 [Athalia rosae]
MGKYITNSSAKSAISFDSAYRFATEDDIFFENFKEQSKSGNPRTLVDIARGISELRNLSVVESYEKKNNEWAKKFLANADNTDEIAEKLSNIKKALFAAEIMNCDDMKIFFNAIKRQIHYSYTLQYFEKCLEECRYMMAIIMMNDKVDVNLIDATKYRLYKIECLSYETRCLKILGMFEKARTIAREGMKEAKYLFQKMEEEGAAINDEKKLDTLGPFLDVLKEHKENDLTKICAMAKNSNGATKIVLPKVYGKKNDKLQSCSDAVTLCFDKVKGRHLVATKNIKTGSVLILDEPFAWSTDENMLENNCLHCHHSLAYLQASKIPCHNCQTVNFCSEDCRRESWQQYHRWECTIFDYFYRMKNIQSSRLLLAYRTTVLLATKEMKTDDFELSSELKKYYSNSDDDSKRLKIGTGDEYDPLDYWTVYSLETNSKNIDPRMNLMHAMHSVILAKCFKFVSSKVIPKVRIGEEEESALACATLCHLQAINSNAYEIVENVSDERTNTWRPRTVGGAIYTTVSLTNHSCIPNIVRHTHPRGKVVVRAIRFIRKGTEILDCYGPHFLSDSKSERKAYLRKKYNFDCACEACDKNLFPATTSGEWYKCNKCFAVAEKLQNCCANCASKFDRMKIDRAMKKSLKRKVVAIQKMLDGDHAAALPILLGHAEIVDKIFADYSLEAVKTQQALIQCLNSMGCIAK